MELYRKNEIGQVWLDFGRIVKKYQWVTLKTWWEELASIKKKKKKKTEGNHRKLNHGESTRTWKRENCIGEQSASEKLDVITDLFSFSNSPSC